MNVSKFTSTLIVLSLSITAAPSTMSDTGWYVGVGAGRSDTGPTFDDDNGAKVFLGYVFNKKVTVQGGFVDLGKFDDREFPGDSVELRGIQLMGIGTLAVKDNLSVFGKLGFFNWDGDVRTTGARDKSEDGTDPMLGIGAQFDVGKHLGVRTEYEHFNVDSALIGFLSVSLVMKFTTPSK